MKNIINIITLAFILAIALTSCFEDPIDLDLNENNKKLAIEAWINTLDEAQFVNLTYTRNFLGQEEYETVSGANVILSESMGDEYILQETESGRYRVPENWIPVYDKDYTLSVSVENETFSATHTLRESPTIEDLEFTEYFSLEDSLLGYQTVFALQETPGLGDAYYVIDYEKGTTEGDTLLNGGYADDEFFDGEYVEGIQVSEEDRLFELGDTAVVEVYSIGRESSLFLLDVELEVFRGGPFDPPPANVRTNFDGDVVGYFIMSGADRDEIVIE